MKISSKIGRAAVVVGNRVGADSDWAGERVGLSGVVMLEVPPKVGSGILQGLEAGEILAVGAAYACCVDSGSEV